jgi:hypothetical protein
MEVSFGKKDGSAPAETVGQTGTKGNIGDAGAPSSEPVKQSEALASGGLLLGDKLPTLRDIILPRLNIVQASGQLARAFPFGSLVYNQQTVLYSQPDIDMTTGNIRRAGTPPLVITVLGFRPTRFAEKVSGGTRGLIVDTEEQVRSNGGTLDYNEWTLKKASGMRRFEPLADAMIAIERPAFIKDDDTVFAYPVDDKKYALALWGLKGTAYTAACKRVWFHQRAMGCLRVAGYPSFSWNVSTRTEAGENPYAVPVVLPAAKSTPAFLEFVKSVLTAPEASVQQ